MRARAGAIDGKRLIRPSRSERSFFRPLSIPRQNQKLLVVSGLLREARSAGRTGVSTLCSGGRGDWLRAALERIDPAPYWGVVSFGIAGALDPVLAPGDMLVGTGVWFDGERICAANHLSATLMDRLRARRRRVGTGLFAGAEEAVLCVAGKAALRRRTGAVAVDTESHVAADWARRNGLPLSILRVVSDPAHRALPPLAARAVRPDGRVDLPRVLRDLARSPRQIGAMAHAGRDSRAAFAALGRCQGVFDPFSPAERVSLPPPFLAITPAE